MKTFKNIQEWIASNPSQEEINKVLILIHRGETNSTRKALYEKEQYLRKVMKGSNTLASLGIKLPPSIVDEIKKTKSDIEKLRKDLPVIAPRAKREKTPVVE